MESCRDDRKYTLTLTELHQLYMNRLQDFGIEKEANKTCLKSCILSQFPGKLQGQSDGKNVLLVFNKGMAFLLREELWNHHYESWTASLEEAGIASSGTAESFLKLTHFNKNKACSTSNCFSSP